MQKYKIRLYPTLDTKVNSKWINHLNQQSGIIKLLEENIGNTLQDKGIGKGFLEKSPEAQATKAKINKWDSIKLRRFCTTKETINKVKGQPTERGIVFLNYATDTGSIKDSS